MKWLALAVLCCLLQDPPRGERTAPAQRFAQATADYRAARYVEAFVGYQALFAEQGPAAAPELLGNLALAALQRHRPGDAEPAARALLQRADADAQALGAFLLGHAAWLRAETGRAAAKLQDAEPMAFATAEAQLDQAVALWLRADQLRPGWPEAVRNAERAAALREVVQQERQAAERNRPKPKQEPDRPEPEPPPTRPEQNEEQQPDAARDALSPQELARLLERLQQKDREKRLARQAQQRGSAVAGERDW